MKNLVRPVLLFTVASTCVALNALGQDPVSIAKTKAAVDARVQVEITRAMGTQFTFDTKVVKGAPYSATAVSESTQMLTDGNRIHSRTATTIYRDSDGRTRREIEGRTPGVAAEVFINDPTSGTSYSLNQRERVAVKSSTTEQIKLITERRMVEQAAKERAQAGERLEPSRVDGQRITTDQLTETQRAVAEKRMQAEKAMSGEARAGGITVTGNALSKLSVSEPLGKQIIEGVLCDGKRTTFTIPANTIGNDLPIVIVTEEWYSPELQVLVMNSRRDPRTGETTYRLTGINRSEPDHALFEVPADFTVRTEKLPTMLKRSPEEQ